MKTKVLKIISITGVSLLILQLIFPFILKFIILILVNKPVDFDSAASVGIIGGADGPTAIFLSSSNDISGKAFLAVSLAMAVVPAFVIWLRKKKGGNL